jgi:hypothetical protein
MKLRLLCLIPILILLAACGGSGGAGYDPYQQLAYAESMGNAAQAAIAATQVKQAELIQQATLQTGQLQVAGTATRASWEFGATATQQSVIGTAVAGQATATYQAQSTQMAGTATAIHQATGTAYPPQATATQAAVNEIARQDAARAEKARWASMVAPINAILPSVIGFTCVGMLIIGAALAYRRLLPVWEMRLRAFRRGPDEMPFFLLNPKSGEVLVGYDPGRSYGPATVIRPGSVQASGLAPDPRMQLRVTTQEQAVQLMRALPPGSIPARSAGQLAASVLTPHPEPPAAPPTILPASPPLAQALNGWQGKELPLGMGADGLVLVDPDRNPHILFAGTTGSAKTHSGLRPYAAAALAAGWQVVILDKSGIDFHPFRVHPNCRIVEWDNPREPIAYLAALYELVCERQRLLAGELKTTWGQLPNAGPRILAVIDEFSNLADMQDNGNDREALWREARKIVAEGRKAGIHLAIALQDPTHKSLDLRIRRNMTPVAFRVRDAEASRVILGAPGAESLPDRQFLTVISTVKGRGLVRGVGLENHDTDLANWMLTRPVAELPDPTWIDAVDVEARDIPSIAPLVDSDTEAKIRALFEQGIPVTRIAEQVFGYHGGEGFKKVRTVLGLL